MREMRPVDVVVDLDVGETGFVSDETMAGPVWTTAGVSQFFFGRKCKQWLAYRMAEGLVVLDGEPVVVPRRTAQDWRGWRLIDVERTAHALTQSGHLGVDQLVRVIRQVRLVAESWGYIPASEIDYRVETYDPNRTEVHSVERDVVWTDDLDYGEPAAERLIVLGDLEYHVDLSDRNWAKLVESLAPYLAVARVSSRRTADRRPRDTRVMIRDWAQQNGYPVRTRGKIPVPIMQAYLARRSVE